VNYGGGILSWRGCSKQKDLENSICHPPGKLSVELNQASANYQPELLKHCH